MPNPARPGVSKDERAHPQFDASGTSLNHPRGFRHSAHDVAIVGGGPAGLMAAEAAAGAGANVTVFDAMASVGRKILIAGKGGLNLTHSEPLPEFITRFGDRAQALDRHLHDFTPQQLRGWAAELGSATVVGSSGRVFPADYKAAPFLRRWLHRLREQRVQFALHHRWHGWTRDGALKFNHRGEEVVVTPGATVLALGGASWPRLGSDGVWCEILAARGIPIATLKPANCGFEIGWSDHLRQRFSGHPVKSISITAFDNPSVAGEFIVTDYGVEGGPFYRLSATLRDAIDRDGRVRVALDLTPAREESTLLRALARPRGKRSISDHLRRTVRIDGIKGALLRELVPRRAFDDPPALAGLIKALPLELVATRPLAEAISTAGGVVFDALDDGLMLRTLPGVFCAGEMVDWEAPTGGYLLTACLAMGRTAGTAAAAYVG